MKKIAYVLKVGQYTYNIYDVNGNIIGGTMVYGKPHSFTTNGDTYTISVIKDGALWTYVFDNDSKMVSSNSVAYKDPEEIKKESKPTTSSTYTQFKYEVPAQKAPEPKVFIGGPAGGDPRDSDYYRYGKCPIRNFLSRLFHLIHGSILAFIIIACTPILGTTWFGIICFAYTYVWYEVCSENGMFNFRRRIYKYIMIYDILAPIIGFIYTTGIECGAIR